MHHYRLIEANEWYHHDFDWNRLHSFRQSTVYIRWISHHHYQFERNHWTSIVKSPYAFFARFCEGKLQKVIFSLYKELANNRAVERVPFVYLRIDALKTHWHARHTYKQLELLSSSKDTNTNTSERTVYVHTRTHTTDILHWYLRALERWVVLRCYAEFTFYLCCIYCQFRQRLPTLHQNVKLIVRQFWLKQKPEDRAE